MKDKDGRQAALLKLIENGDARTQGDLLGTLRGDGILVDQSTLSRDLSEMGIRKAGGRYVLPEHRESPNNKIDYSGAVNRFTTCGPHLLIVHTGVGQAQPVALAIEGTKEPAIIGTLAGDDTIFLATKNRRTQTVVLRRLKQWFGDKHE